MSTSGFHKVLIFFVYNINCMITAIEKFIIPAIAGAISILALLAPVLADST